MLLIRKTSADIVRQPAWHGLGTVLHDAATSADALKRAKLSWNVAQSPVQWMESDGTLRVTDSYMCNYRDDNGTLLGIVGRGYTVVQNTDAFEFADHLIGEGVQYEYVGSNKGGKRVWLLAKMPERTILNDAYAPYLLFANGHDGNTAINVCMTPMLCEQRQHPKCPFGYLFPWSDFPDCQHYRLSAFGTGRFRFLRE